MQSKLLMKEFVINLLDNRLPSFYYYHNHRHTLYVMEKAIEIGTHEACTAEETDLLTAAALWHDTGYITTYENHEEESCALAKQYLPDFGYSPADIHTICGMIMATKIPQSPHNKLEEIIADADLEYLGTESAGVKATDLFKERQCLNPGLTKSYWNKNQISFLQHHHYFTRFCKENREPVKQAYLHTLAHTASKDL